MSEVSKMEIFSPYSRTGCCFPASTPGTDKLLLSMVAIPVDSLSYFSCSIVRKPDGVRVLRSANRETEKLSRVGQPEVFRILRRFSSSVVDYACFYIWYVSCVLGQRSPIMRVQTSHLSKRCVPVVCVSS